MRAASRVAEQTKIGARGRKLLDRARNVARYIQVPSTVENHAVRASQRTGREDSQVRAVRRILLDRVIVKIRNVNVIRGVDRESVGELKILLGENRPYSGGCPLFDRAHPGRPTIGVADVKVTLAIEGQIDRVLEAGAPISENGADPIRRELFNRAARRIRDVKITRFVDRHPVGAF
jgi:hypothetical protein